MEMPRTAQGIIVNMEAGDECRWLWWLRFPVNRRRCHLHICTLSNDLRLYALSVDSLLYIARCLLVCAEFSHTPPLPATNASLFIPLRFFLLFTYALLIPNFHCNESIEILTTIWLHTVHGEESQSWMLPKHHPSRFQFDLERLWTFSLFRSFFLPLLWFQFFSFVLLLLITASTYNQNCIVGITE